MLAHSLRGALSVSCGEAWWQRVLTRWHASHREQRSDRDMVTILSVLVTEIYNYNRPLSLASEILPEEIIY